MIPVAQAPESYLGPVKRDIRQEQNNATTLDQDFVAPAPCHIPFEVVCVRIEEHQHRERMSSGVVFWTGSDRDAVVIVRQNERMMEFSKKAEGRPKGAVEPRKRGPVKISKN